MKTRWCYILAGLTLSLLCLSSVTMVTSAIEVWRDDFETGLDGWTFFGYENTSNITKTEGNFSAASGMLEVLDNDVNVARHDSDTNVGTWRFDMFVPEDHTGTIYLEFMSNGWDHFNHLNSSVAVVGAKLYEDRFYAWCLVGSGYHKHKAIIVDPLYGWHHIEVSRTIDNRTLIYFNGTLEADFVCTEVTNSTYLQLWCEGAKGAAIDNLVVDNDPHAIVTTMLIVAGGGIAVVAIVLVVVFARHRSTNQES